MLLAQEFKTIAGAQKRAAFENAHCGDRYLYIPIRCVNGRPDQAAFDQAKFTTYTWRLERTTRA